MEKINFNEELLYSQMIKRYHIEDSDNVYRKKVDEQMCHDFVDLYEKYQILLRENEQYEEKIYTMQEKLNSYGGK